jgi:hypothetical protein
MSAVVRERGKYHTYDEMLSLLQDWVKAYPEICALESIGGTPEGRELWLLTLTLEGDASSKPAFWCEANTHAGEVTGTEAVLQMGDELITKFAAGDATTVALLRSSTIYLLPRIAVDGAEKYLTTEYSLRSSPRSASDQPPEWPGLVARDIDGNGELLMMRIKDPAGSFKKSEADPRVMVPRGPAEYGGEYFRLLPEGEFAHFDAQGAEGGEPRVGKPDQYDLNRAFPTGFRPGQQSGGPHPMYLDEAQHVVRAITERNNICTMLTHHTSGRLLIMPAGGPMPAGDRRMFEDLNKFGEELTGYKIVGRRSAAPGPTTKDWAFYHRGIYVWLPEIWNLHDYIGLQGSLDGTADDELIDSLARDATVDDPAKYPDTHATQYERPYHNLVKILQWAEENLPEGTYFEDWQAFLHPQLGEVEIGGFLFKKLLQNPPPQLLEQEVQKLTDFGSLLAGALPRVRVASAEALPLGAPGESPVSRVVLHVVNEGYMGTGCTEQAAAIGAVRGEGIATLTLLDGGQQQQQQQQVLSAGRPQVGSFPHLEGRQQQRGGGSGYSTLHPSRYENWTDRFNANECQLEWVVAGSGTVRISLDFQRGGVHEVEVELAPAPQPSL